MQEKDLGLKGFLVCGLLMSGEALGKKPPGEKTNDTPVFMQQEQLEVAQEQESDFEMVEKDSLSIEDLDFERMEEEPQNQHLMASDFIKEDKSTVRVSDLREEVKAAQEQDLDFGEDLTEGFQRTKEELQGKQVQEELEAHDFRGESGGEEDIASKQLSDIKLDLSSLQNVGAHKQELCQQLKYTGAEETIDFHKMFAPGKETSSSILGSCSAFFSKACSLGQQVWNSNNLTGNEAGGTFGKNVYNLICETSIFNEWSFLKAKELKDLFLLYGSFNDVILFKNLEGEVPGKPKVAFIPSSLEMEILTQSLAKIFDQGMREGKRLYPLLEKLAGETPEIDRFLVPLSVIMGGDVKSVIVHEILLELNMKPFPHIVVWDPLSSVSTKYIKPAIQGILDGLQAAQTKITVEKDTHDEEVITIDPIKSNSLNLYDASLHYKELSFQLPGTGNCTRFSLFFALLRSEDEDLNQYTIGTANNFCTFVKQHDQKK